MIYPCACKDEYQDRRYGGGKRVFTLGNSKRICTKCGKVVQDNSVVNPAQKKGKVKK